MKINSNTLADELTAAEGLKHVALNAADAREATRIFRERLSLRRPSEVLEWLERASVQRKSKRPKNKRKVA